MEFAFVFYPEDSSNLPSRTNEVIRLEKRLLAACKGEDTFLPCFLVDSFHGVKICTFFPSHAQRLMVFEAKNAGDWLLKCFHHPTLPRTLLCCFRTYSSECAAVRLVLTITELTTFYYSCNDRMFAFESRKELFAIWPKHVDLSV